ncbi:hypothetical protein QN395_19515 [Undibacterium sp. RTI2.2]|nr:MULTISPECIES: hypothetical protein [unclassified Undibacterium]MDY7540730.1 hypothetical protein [Undibacterium sp. 5I1]MEB0118678.1 hypothetical protein [Undibacterium sp. RTI2.2]MEB0232648.1 hypothetical protein [Undibacterium sp. 10I3]MEB0259633.1 hypothetical protein [Undibacterium sp. 5I1]
MTTISLIANVSENSIGGKRTTLNCMYLYAKHKKSLLNLQGIGLGEVKV